MAKFNKETFEVEWEIVAIEIVKDIRLVWPKEDMNFAPCPCEHISEVEFPMSKRRSGLWNRREWSM